MEGMNRAGIIAVLFAILLASAAFSQIPNWMETVPSAEVRLEPERVRLGAEEPAEITIFVKSPPGHHAYLDKGEDGALLPVEFIFSDLERSAVRPTRIGAPAGQYVAEYRATVMRGEGAFRYRLDVMPGADVGEAEFEIDVRVQICNEATGACYFPETYKLKLTADILSVPEGPAYIPGGTEVGPISPGADIGDIIASFPDYSPRNVQPARSLAHWLLLAFLAGMILNVMPCVLPLISIRALNLMQQAGRSRGRLFALGLAFAAGMMAVFIALGLVAALFGLGWGEQFQSQTFRVVMISIVFLFGLALFGLYEIGLPSGVSNLGAGSRLEGFGGTFWMGVLATILATPCSGPFLGATLAWALAQPPAVVLMIFTTMGLGMATPHIAISAHPGLMKIIPKPGAWMETFKHVTGFILMAMVVYLMISLDQNMMLFVVAFLLFLSIAAWAWGRFTRRPSGVRGRVIAVAVTLLIILGGAYISFGFLQGLYGPQSGASEAGELQYEPFDPARLLEYHARGRNVFLKFTADWCINCKINEVRVYNTEPVRNLLRDKNAVVMKADLTHQGDMTNIARGLMAKLGARAIPFMAVFPGDSPQTPYTLFDLVDRDSVVEILQSLPE